MKKIVHQYFTVEKISGQAQKNFPVDSRSSRLSSSDNVLLCLLPQIYYPSSLGFFFFMYFEHLTHRNKHAFPSIIQNE